MSRRKRKKKKKKKLRKEIKKVVKKELKGFARLNLHPETKTSIVALFFICAAVLLVLSALEKAGPAGRMIYAFSDYLLGVGYFALPVLLLTSALLFVLSVRIRPRAVVIGGLILLLSSLGMTDIVQSGSGGLIGSVGGLTERPFGYGAGLFVNAFLFLVGILVTFNVPLKAPRINTDILNKDIIPRSSDDTDEDVKVVGPSSDSDKSEDSNEAHSAEQSSSDSSSEKDASMNQSEKNSKDTSSPTKTKSKSEDGESLILASGTTKKYNHPPLSLLEDASGTPSSGDIKANANTIRRTLASFNIPVEMAEVQVGPKVTRYSLKPAEGVKLSKIVNLQNDLALALAAHPIRIEAPIPGKSLVGVEVPNKASALVRLKHLMTLDKFQKSRSLVFAVGKDVSGEPMFADITKMPHLLIAGSSGAGKSVTIHSLLVSLLYKNSPELLRLILIDPKRVELSVYNDLPHMATPVITDPKKAILALKFAIKEMDERYDMLLDKGSRDIFSYNQKCIKEGEPILPYIVIVIDELADLMATYPREIEGSIVRLAQMARATGIHLVVSTQRPSVEVVTGLIKANITSRVALQVASQVDSRTILDSAGAEKLLGGGDLLFVSSEISKPKRIQGAFLSEKEVKRVADYIRAHNGVSNDEVDLNEESNKPSVMVDLEEFDKENVEDELYPDAIKLIKEAGKASASMLQRHLRIGYARAARLLDVMEEQGLIGPQDGAKAREVYIKDEDEENIEKDADDDGEDYMNS